MQKRSITLGGHRTSIALEPAFWEALEAIAAERALTVPRLVAAIDRERDGQNLASAIRTAVLAHFRAGRD